MISFDIIILRVNFFPDLMEPLGGYMPLAFASIAYGGRGFRD